MPYSPPFPTVQAYLDVLYASPQPEHRIGERSGNGLEYEKVGKAWSLGVAWAGEK